MWRKTIAGLFLLFSWWPLRVSAQDHELEKQLKSDYQGKTLTLRHFYHGDHLAFHSDGSLQGEAAIGPWTVDGQLSVQEIRLRKGLLEIEGRRIYVVFDSMGKPVDELATIADSHDKALKDIKETLRSLSVEIEIEMPSRSPAPQDVSSAMRAVFLASGESLMDIVPAYWRNYFAQLENRPDDKPNPAEPFYDMRPHNGVSPPHVTINPDPEYSQAARQVKYQGTALVRLIVDPAGTVRGLQITKPLGIGLDEQAVEAVRTWKFEPAQKDGTPVPVEIHVEVSFHLY